MFEMLVGYPPFYSDDPMSTCRKVRQGLPLLLHENLILMFCFVMEFDYLYSLQCFLLYVYVVSLHFKDLPTDNLQLGSLPASPQVVRAPGLIWRIK